LAIKGVHHVLKPNLQHLTMKYFTLVVKNALKCNIVFVIFRHFQSIGYFVNNAEAYDINNIAWLWVTVTYMLAYYTAKFFTMVKCFRG
jgi:hypothetical protein